MQTSFAYFYGVDYIPWHFHPNLAAFRIENTRR